MKSPFQKVRPIMTTGSIDHLATQLYQLPNKVQFCHHLTTSYAKHKAMDGLYEAISDFKDEIIEKLIGYTGTRFSVIAPQTLSGFTEEMCRQVAQEVVNFGKELEQYGATNGYGDIENLAQSYAGAGAKTLYLLTLS